VSESWTLLHQQPASDSSQANGCPHDLHVAGRLMVGPDRLHARVNFTAFAASLSFHGEEFSNSLGVPGLALLQERSRDRFSPRVHR
jgi:hypothetical protein